jgi:uncharacterized protein (DUF1778 family)
VATAPRELKEKRLYVRVSPRQREVISEAAEALKKDVSAFVLEAVMADAQRVLADRRVFVLDDERWRSFLDAIERPVEPLSRKPRLKRLLEQPSSIR